MKKVLFIEDEPALQRTLTIALKEAGFDALSAFDGETGLNMAKNEKPDIVLLDLIIPKMDGFTVLENLKKDEATKNIPVVVLTNLEATEDVEKVVGLGATTYLVKANYDISEIVAKVKEILGI